MASPFRRMFERAAVLLRQQFGDPVILRFPRGTDPENAEEGIPVSGIWHPNRTELDESLGKTHVLTGRLNVPAGTVFAEQDQWLIDGELWQFRSFEPPNLGYQDLHLRRDAKVRTKRAGGKL